MFREYRESDIEPLVDLTTKVFKETYPGILDDEVFDRLDLSRQVRLDYEIGAYPTRKDKVLLLEIDGNIEGFIEVDKCKHKEYESSGEIEMIYLTKNFQHQGYGKKLFIEGARMLKKLGYKDFYVGCFNGNDNAKFYHHLGGVYKFSKPLMLNRVYQENYFYFEDINKYC